MAEPPGDQPPSEENPEQTGQEPPRQPSQGVARQPSQGVTRQPSQGVARQPSQGVARQPSQGLTRQPSVGQRSGHDLRAVPSTGQDEPEGQAPDQPGQELPTQPPLPQPGSILYQPQQPTFSTYDQQSARGAIYQTPQQRGGLFQARTGVPQEARGGVFRQQVTRANFPQHQDPTGGMYQQPDFMTDYSQPLGGRRRSSQQTSTSRDTQQQYVVQHGPYQAHDPGSGIHQLGTNLYDDQIPDPGSRALAIKNAKAYLLKTSVKSGVSL